MIKNKSNLAIKLFIAVWIVLALHITLKLTFNYWQPYVIPNDTLQVISDYIDNNYWLKVIIDKSLYIINGLLMLLSSIQCWWFKKKYPIILILIGALLSFIDDFTPYNTIIDSIITLILCIALPLIINIKKWLPTILTFGFTNLFMALSLWLEGFVTTNDMNYIIKVYLQMDYYIMLIMNYFVFNFIDVYSIFKKLFKRKKEVS